MEILVLLTICTLAISTSPSSIKTIAIKDHDFVGEDPVLTEVLAKKGDLNFTLNLPTIKNFDIDLPEFLTVDEKVYMNRSHRRYDYLDYTFVFDNDPKEYTIRFKILDMMRQDIYATQQRIDVLSKKIKRYLKRPEFRLAYIFGKLQDWLFEMQVMWTVVKKGRAAYEEDKTRRFRVYKHMLYYTHMLRRDFDITYTVEDLIRIHNNLTQKVKKGLPNEDL